MVNRSYDLDLDIADLDLQQWLGFDPGQVLDLSLAAPVDLTAEAALHLGFGFDLADVFDPFFFVDAASGISAGVVGEAPDIDATLAIDLPSVGVIDLPPLGLFVENGSARVKLGAYANLANPDADSRRRRPCRTRRARRCFPGRVFRQDQCRPADLFPDPLPAAGRFRKRPRRRRGRRQPADGGRRFQRRRNLQPSHQLRLHAAAHQHGFRRGAGLHRLYR